MDLQRGVVQNERRQRVDNQPYGLAEEGSILGRLYPPVIPTAGRSSARWRTSPAASIEDVRNFFRTNYAPNNATIVIAGAISPAEARRLAERWFGDIPRGPEVQRNHPAGFTLDHNVFHLPGRPRPTARLYNARHTVRAFADDDAAISVLTDILAGGRSSRLYKKLVYELQIATQVSAYHDALKMDGSFRLSATARPGHDLNELQREIDGQIRSLADSGPTAREVERVQHQTEAQFLGQMETVLGKADQLNQYQYFVGTPDYFQQDLERYLRVTPGDVQRVARQYLASAHRVVLSVVPQGRTNLRDGRGGTMKAVGRKGGRAVGIGATRGRVGVVAVVLFYRPTALPPYPRVDRTHPPALAPAPLPRTDAPDGYAAERPRNRRVADDRSAGGRHQPHRARRQRARSARPARARHLHGEHAR